MKKQTNSKIAGLLLVCFLTSGLLIQGQSLSQSAHTDMSIPADIFSNSIPLSNEKVPPLITPDQPVYIYAGEDATICIGDYIYELNGACTYPGPVLWQTSGDGQFSDPTSLNCFYQPGYYDTSMGEVTLYLYLNNPDYGDLQVYDMLTLSFVDCTLVIPSTKDL